MPIIVIAFGLFAGGMFVYRKMTDGESFSLEKFLPTMGIGALASIVLYLAAGAMPSLDSVLAQIELMMPGGAPSMTVIISALLVVYNTYMKGTGATTTTTTAATQAATTEQAKSTLAGTGTSTSTETTPVAFEPSPVSPAGKGIILGIYGHSASGGTPSATATFDVNQVPEIFFDIQTVVTGKIMMSLFIDGKSLKDWSEQGVALTTIGEKIPLAFWIPQNYRTVGTHIITIMTGHLTGAQSIASGGTDSKTVWDASQDFGLIFTGTKIPTD